MLKDPAPENPVAATFEKAAESEKLAGKSAPTGIQSIEPEKPQIEAQVQSPPTMQASNQSNTVQ